MNILLSGLEKLTVKLKAANVNNRILKSISRKYKKKPSLSRQRGKFSDLQTLKKQLSVSHINEIFSLTQPHKFLAEKQKKNHHNQVLIPQPLSSLISSVKLAQENRSSQLTLRATVQKNLASKYRTTVSDVALVEYLSADLIDNFQLTMLS